MWYNISLEHFHRRTLKFYPNNSSFIPPQSHDFMLQKARKCDELQPGAWAAQYRMRSNEGDKEQGLTSLALKLD